MCEDIESLIYEFYTSNCMKRQQVKLLFGHRLMYFAYTVINPDQFN